MKTFLKKYQYLFVFFLILSLMLVYIGINYWLFGRIWLSIKHFGLNMVYYFMTIYSHDAIPPLQVLDSMLIDSGASLISILPVSFVAFLDKLLGFLAILITGRNLGVTFSLFITEFIKFLYLVNILAMFLPILILFNYLYFLPSKLAVDTYSRPLKTYNKFAKFIEPIKTWFVNFYYYVFERWYLKWPLIFVFVIMINALPLAIDVISWYFYFVACFDWTSLYKLFVVIVIDLYDFFSFFHWSVYAIAAYLIFDSLRKAKAYEKLDHNENYNKGFIKSTGIVVLFDGVPGSGKTELMTDFDLSADQIFRDDVFGIMKEVDALYPHFNFRLLEIDVEEGMNQKLFHNRSQLRKHLYDKFSSINFDNVINSLEEDFYSYDFGRYGQVSYLGLGLEHITQSLVDYAQAYFLYVMSCSFLISNYAIRTDGKQIDFGHLKIWNYDFFRTELDSYHYSRQSKILPLDALRFGTQMIKANPKSFVLDNCIVSVNESDKDFGNQFDIRAVDANSSICNYANQKINITLKLGRHPATLRFRTLWKFTGDLQRFGSVNSDFHELSSTKIHVSEKNDFKIAIPFYWIEPAICEWLLSFLDRVYYKFRLFRSDNTLLINAVRVLRSWIYKYYTKRLNTFGYWKLSLLVSDGSLQTENNVPQKYFLAKKKIHNDRYSTDAYSEFFAERYAKATVGLVDLDEFGSTKATPDELRSIGSIFIKALGRETEDALNNASKVDDKQESVIVNDLDKPLETAITL